MVLYGAVIWAAIRRYKQEKVKVAEIGTAKPAFPEFYKAWKAEKNKEQLKKGLAVAGVLATIVFGVAAAAQKQQAYDDLRRIREKLDRP